MTSKLILCARATVPISNIRGILAGRISGGLLYGILRHESWVESEEKAIQFLPIAEQIALV